LEFAPRWEKQVIKATHNTLFHFLERLAMRDSSNSEGSVHHFVAKGVCHLLDVTLPKAYREIVKRKTTEIFKVFDNRNLYPQPTDMEMLGNVHLVL
jgi:prophage antirepressor-like protein